MALLLKRGYESYFQLMNDIADPRANDYILLRSPISIVIILFLWYKFVFQWGPEYMKNRLPFDLKRIILVYNIVQVISNGYIVYNGWLARHIIDWSCFPIDYSDSYWGRKMLFLAHMYFLLKLADLLDTVFFVLRKKDRNLSFLHTYHHFVMVIAIWVGAKFLGGGHSYFLGMANSIVHTIMYSYYLLTSYDSSYGQLMWLKKSITLMQLGQFVFILWTYGKLLLKPDCNYPKPVIAFLIPQNLFMIAMFSDFYVKNYIVAPRRK